MAIFFVCTFPEILVQTRCKSANVRTVVPIVGFVLRDPYLNPHLNSSGQAG